MRNRHRGALPALLIWLAAAGGSGLADEVPSPNADFFDTIEVNLVNVEVYVADSSGNPVTGLTEGDFTVFEDGSPVEIANFYAAHAERQSRLPEDQRLDLVLLFDNVDLTPRSRQRIVQALRDSLLRELDPENRVMVVDYDGSVNVLGGLSRNPETWVPIFDELARRRTPTPHLRQDRSTILRQLSGDHLSQPGDERSAEPNLERNDLSGLLVSVRTYAQEQYRTVEQRIAALIEFVDALSGLPGRKALLYVTTGMPLRPGEALFRAWDERQSGTGRISVESEIRRFDAAPLLEKLGQHANANRVTFYTILAEASAPALAATERRAELASPYGSGGGWHERVETVEEWNVRSAMQLLAELTGGVAVLDSADIEPAMKRLQRDFEAYYSLGYLPPTDGDGKNHRITVRVGEEGLQLRHREGYRNKTGDERMSDRVRSALLFEAGENPLQVTVDVGKAKLDAQGRFQVPITVRLPVSNLLLLPLEHFHEGRVAIFVGSRDSQGKSSEIQKSSAPIRIPNNRLLTALGQIADFEMTLIIRGGENALAIGVRDELSNVESTIRVVYTPGAG